MRGFVDGEYQDGEIRGLVFICGMRGMGKTTEMDRLLGLCGGGVVFFDSLSKHAEILEGYKVLSQPGDLEEYLRVNQGRRFHVLYQPRKGKLDHHFQSVCLCVRLFGAMILAIDELDKLCGPRWGDTRMCPELDHLVNYGRHEKVSMIATARRPTGVARGYTAEAELRLFKIKEQGYIDYFADLVGKEDAARLRTLEKFQFLHCKDDSEAELCGGRR
jgi:hypothetical protein